MSFSVNGSLREVQKAMRMGMRDEVGFMEEVVFELGPGG